MFLVEGKKVVVIDSTLFTSLAFSGLGTPDVESGVLLLSGFASKQSLTVLYRAKNA